MFDHHKKKEEDEVIIVVEENITNVFINEPHYHYRLVLSSLSYKNLNIKNSIIMALTLSTNEFATGALGLVDHATGSPITGATFANITAVSGDTSIFTVAPNATDPNSIDVTGVTVGTANLTVTATVTYVDPATGQSLSVSKTAIISVTITQGTTTADLVVNFGAPQQKP